jgi:hypothetical protein
MEHVIRSIYVWLNWRWPVACKPVASNDTEVQAMLTAPVISFATRLLPLLTLLAAPPCVPAQSIRPAAYFSLLGVKEYAV